MEIDEKSNKFRLRIGEMQPYLEIQIPLDEPLDPQIFKKIVFEVEQTLKLKASYMLHLTDKLGGRIPL